MCANHFLGPARTNFGAADPFDTRVRLNRLSCAVGGCDRFDVPAAWAALAEVSQGEMTIQSVVVEPQQLALHVALGAGPAARPTPTELNLAEWF